MEAPQKESSFIKTYRYDAEHSTLIIEMKNGKIYTYQEVPREVYESMLESVSAGSFFGKNVRGRYTVLVEEPVPSEDSNAG